MMLGIWKNFDELEENICLAELEVLLNKSRKEEMARRKFAAALKGVDVSDSMPENTGAKTFEDVKRQALAKARGVSEDSLAFGEIGFGFSEEQE